MSIFAVLTNKSLKLMRKLNHGALAMLCATAILITSCTNQPVETGSYDIIPLPKQVCLNGEGAPFVVKPSTTIAFPEGNAKMESTARLLAGYIKEMTGTAVKTAASTGGKGCIVLTLDPTIGNSEGYRLTVTDESVTLAGATEAAVFLGCQTICKALPLTDGKALGALPAGEVNDVPRYPYRGFLIDVGRHFFPVDYLKELIDVMALHGINYFHWHLTEDQGWRIEIKKYPRLTEIGSTRPETIVAPGTDIYDGKPVSGYYTQEEAREIVEYAAERFITVIPEVDLPGHTLAALTAYPEMGCSGGPYTMPTKFGVFDEVLCGGNDKALQFAKDVINEIMDIFPSEYIHIGGDECPKVNWERCPRCQAKIRELGLRPTRQHSKENQLQAWFMGEIGKEIAARGRKMMAWDEILEGNPDKSVTVMAWTSTRAVTASAKLGHKTVVCPILYLYFSNPRMNRLMGEDGVKRVYGFNPVTEGLTPEEAENIIGAQGCIWTEWTKDSIKMEWQMMPRIAALSELQWSDAEKDYDGFIARLRRHIEIYKMKGWNFKSLDPADSAKYVQFPMP